MDNIIYEYEEITDSKVVNHIKSNKSLYQYFKPSFAGLRARQYCGILNIENEDYYILPKIANHNNEQNLNIFIYMLMYSYDINLKNEQIASSKNETHETIFEAFIQFFAKNLLKEFQKGIYKEYITEQDNLTTLRGKYLINENLKYNFTKNKIYCEYDESSENNKLNQFFHYAIKLLIRYVKNKKLLKQCDLILDGVEYKHIDINQFKINFNRLNNRFKHHYEFAMLLLNKFIPLFEKDKKSFAFLFDMNELFEKFIGRIIQEKFDDVEIPKSYQKFGKLYLKPDFIVKSKNLIIDCKYKIAEEKKLAKREDRYQMYAYGNNFENIEMTMLLYPQHLEKGKIEKRFFLGENEKKVELLMKSINLNFNGKYNEFINEIQNRMENI